jgi:hypothetical protein
MCRFYGASYQQWVLTVKYCLVAVHMDSGYIHVEASDPSMPPTLQQHEAMLDFFRQRLGTVETLRLDRNAPAAANCSGPASPAKAPVANHRTWRLGARCAWKNHFIASWATADVACPPPLWATTVEHCELTLNLCRPSYHKSISAWQGSTATIPIPLPTLGPVGCKVQVFLCRADLLVSTLRKGSTSARS